MGAETYARSATINLFLWDSGQRKWYQMNDTMHYAGKVGRTEVVITGLIPGVSPRHKIWGVQLSIPPTTKAKAKAIARLIEAALANGLPK
jgi:hypothetical protein